MRDWPRSTTQAGDALRDLLARMGCVVRARATTGSPCGATARSRASTPTCTTSASSRRCSPRSAPSPTARRTSAGSRTSAATRPTGSPRSRPSCAASAPTSPSTPTGSSCGPATLHGGLFHTYADHRMAHAAAVLGSAVDGVVVDDVAATARRSRTSRVSGQGCWTPDERPLRRERPGALRAPAPPHPAAHQGASDLRRRRRRPSSPRSTAAGSRCWSTASSVWAVKARPLGRKGVVVGDRVRVVGDVSGEDGALARIVEVQERTTVLRRTADDDDPVERVVVANADQLVVVTALADPEPRPRLIDRALVAAFVVGDEAPAVPDQGRPGRPRDAAGDLPLARRALGGHPARRRPDRAARAARRPHQRADRAQRRRQVHAGQRAGPRTPTATSAS